MFQIKFSKRALPAEQQNPNKKTNMENDISKSVKYGILKMTPSQ